jgi:selenide,water dikinase
MSEIKLLSLSKGSGCGCKIQPAILETLLEGLRFGQNEKIVIGNTGNDDCSVYDLGNDLYLLQTVDFFTPLVNDAPIFGAAAAANALSDIYAMGGKPIMANAIFSWPIDELSLDLAKQVLQGGVDMCNSLNVPLAGGHSINGKDPLFGLSVTGLVQKQHLKTNAMAKPGQIIFLTKPLGIGMLSAAQKRELSTPEQDAALHFWLTQNNSIGAELALFNEVGAMTDVTGFGLLGHAMELANASNCSLEMEGINLPKIEEAKNLAAQYVLPDNAMRNWNSYEHNAVLNNPEFFTWLVDPQTNGGLLFTADESALTVIKTLFEKHKKEIYAIGKVIERQEKAVLIN